MTESDKRYYENREIDRQNHIRAISKARHRGEISEQWHKTNDLTHETFPEFKKVMRQADKDWEKANQQRLNR